MAAAALLPPTRRQALNLRLLQKVLGPDSAPAETELVASRPPGTEPITLVCMSDTHCTTPNVPAGDILVHAGDLTEYGTRAELQDQLNWLAGLPHKHKIVIAGNHDLVLDPTLTPTGGFGGDGHSDDSHHSSTAARSPPINWHDLTYLENKAVEVEVRGRKVNIYGCPHVPRNGKTAFGYEDDEGAAIWAGKVPDNTDVLLTHGPPHGYRDSTRAGAAVSGGKIRHIGCTHLLREIWRVKPRVVVCGHVHSCKGRAGIVYDDPRTRARDGLAMGQYPSSETCWRPRPLALHMVAPTPSSSTLRQCTHSAVSVSAMHGRL